MKRFIQIVALAVVVLLAAQPALANASCSYRVCGSDLSAPNCCMHAGDMSTHDMSSDEAMSAMDAMDSMSAGCRMQGHAALTEAFCADETVCMSQLPSVPQLIAIHKQMIGVVSGAVLPQVAAEVLMARAVRSMGPPAAASSARYILFQVFRI